jgi:Tfp pilus assembly pilus retraction ATPase PilT
VKWNETLIETRISTQSETPTDAAILSHKLLLRSGISRLLPLLALPAVVQAQFSYKTNNGTITVTGYTGSGGAVRPGQMIPFQKTHNKIAL